MLVHEGEILLKEKYGSSPAERFYIRPPEQTTVVLLDENDYGSVTGFFTKIFLPQGYPDSVSKDYLAYQKWDTAQAFCSTITGILATQEVLRGVGVGDTTATPLSATITWVVKDGCGHIGRILFAFSHGTHLDAYSKTWRLYADTLNDAAMCIEIALPMFRNYTTFALCISTVMKAIVGVAGSATRVAMTQHHAVRGNMADVAAKDAAQETAVNLVASMAALMIISLFGNSVFIFITMIILHIICNYFAVRAVCLKTLNEPRFLQVIDKYLNQEVITAPCEINQCEPIIFYMLGSNVLDLKMTGFRIRLGESLQSVSRVLPKAGYLSAIKDIYEDRNYLLLPDVAQRCLFVLLRDDADTDDALCAYFHATLLAMITCAINDAMPNLDKTADPKPFAQVCLTLQAAEWSRQDRDGDVPDNEFTYEPSLDLMKYVDKLVNNEWRRTRTGLLRTGWDLSKHLLLLDEWRVCSEKIPFNPIGSMLTLRDSSIVRLPGSSSLMFTDGEGEFLTEKFDDIDAEGEFTIEPDYNVEKPNGMKLPTMQGFDLKIQTATEVKPNIVPVKKD